MKKVLILCTGNSCRSIIAEALINADLGDCVTAYSSGTRASGKVNSNAKKVLQENKIWSNDYNSKILEKVLNIDFDLVVTVCDNAKESCPIFPVKTDVLHCSFTDPDGKEYVEFIKTYNEIKEKLLPIVKEALC